MLCVEKTLQGGSNRKSRAAILSEEKGKDGVGEYWSWTKKKKTNLSY